MAESLQPAEFLASASDWKGNAIVYNAADPRQAFRISEMMRVLLLCFPPNRATAVTDAIDLFCKYSGVERTARLARTLNVAVLRLANLGVLVRPLSSEGGYNNQMGPSYARSRPVPREIASTILREAHIGATTKILDIGTGTGSLALQLASISGKVTGIDVSCAFIEIARHAAASHNLKVDFRKASANQLCFESSQYDVVTVSQAFHWFSPTWATLGIYRALHAGGYLFLIDSDGVLSKNHPLRGFGYGSNTHRSIQHSFDCKLQRYADLFRVMRPMELSLRFLKKWIFRQYRPFDIDFARAFIFERFLKEHMPDEKNPWGKLTRTLGKLSNRDLFGHMYWQVLKFVVDQPTWKSKHNHMQRDKVVDIPYEPCAH